MLARSLCCAVLQIPEGEKVYGGGSGRTKKEEPPNAFDRTCGLLLAPSEKKKKKQLAEEESGDDMRVEETWGSSQKLSAETKVAFYPSPNILLV